MGVQEEGMRRRRGEDVVVVLVEVERREGGREGKTELTNV